MENKEQQTFQKMSGMDFANFLASLGATFVDKNGDSLSTEEFGTELETHFRTSPDKITSLNEDEIFVFGSNLAGKHGGGAAKVALNNFGAIWGQGEGLQGQSYAIPTMHGGIPAIKPYVDRFIRFAEEHPEYKFLVTRIGCGNAGFKDEEMAPLFRKGLQLDNVYLPDSFIQILIMNETPEELDSDVNPVWDSKKWISDFDPANTRLMRQLVFQNTVSIVKKGSYGLEDGSGTVQLELNPKAAEDNVFYEKKISLHNPVHGLNTAIEVVNKDCLVLAHELLEADATDDLCVLNMACATRPGGGVLHGAGAQEEYLFRCSDYFRFLFQYAIDFGTTQYGVEKNNSLHYPLVGNNAGVFSHGVTVFRGPEASGYQLIAKPWKVNFVAVAANHLLNRTDRIPDHLVESSLERIRTILRIAYNNGQRRLVLGAFGCGAFKNPPKHMAQLFRQVFEEDEFKNLFRSIHFAVIEDHNSRNANFSAFMEVF